MTDDREKRAPSGVQTDPGMGPASESSRSRQDDSGELPNAADVKRILEGVVPQTPERLKERTKATRGQDYARYDAKGAPAKAKRSDTLDIAAPVIADDTNVDGLQLSESTIAQIESRRREDDERSDTTVSGDEPRRRRTPIFVIAGMLGLVLLVIYGWHQLQREDGIPVPPAIASSTPSSTAFVAVPSTTPAVAMTAPPSIASASTSSTSPAVIAVATSQSASTGSATARPPHSAATTQPAISPSATVSPTATASNTRPDLNPNP